jgi:hypothetical protein
MRLLITDDGRGRMGGLLTHRFRVPLEVRPIRIEREPRGKPLRQPYSRTRGAVDLKTDTRHSRITRGVTPPDSVQCRAFRHTSMEPSPTQSLRAHATAAADAFVPLQLLNLRPS